MKNFSVERLLLLNILKSKNGTTTFVMVKQNRNIDGFARLLCKILIQYDVKYERLYRNRVIVEVNKVKHNFYFRPLSVNSIRGYPIDLVILDKEYIDSDQLIHLRWINPQYRPGSLGYKLNSSTISCDIFWDF